MENKKRRLFVYLLFTASFLMLVVPTIPHHHHKDDPLTICMKNDIEKDHKKSSSEEESHSSTDNNHPFELCLCTQTDQPTTPSFQSETTPALHIVAVFLSNPFLKLLFVKQKAKPTYFHYKDKLASLTISATRGLRAPPSFL